MAEQPKKPSGEVTQFRPRPSELEKRIRQLAQNSDNVRWSAKTYDTHAESQMEWREISDRMMFDVLRTGYLKGDIVPGKNLGEWKTKMCKEMKGQREVGVVVIVIRDRSLFVKTVEWEDLR